MSARVYSNGFGILINETEARIQFTLTTPVLGSNAEISDTETEVVSDIILHPSLLKQLSVMLDETLVQHEKKNGEISLPKDTIGGQNE